MAEPSERRRILQIIPTLDQGGAEKQCALLASGLPADEFEVHVCTLTRNGPWQDHLRAHQIPLHSIHKTKKLDWGAYRRLKELIEELKPDVVHTWLFAANAYGRQAARKSGCPHIVGGERCVDPWKRWWHFAIDRRLARRSDRIVANSTAIRDFYAEHGIDANKFEIIPNGIEVPDSSTNERQEDLFAEVGIPAGSFVCGAIGRLWPQKRIKDLIWSADLVKCVRDDFYLVIVGDGPLRASLEDYAKKVQVTDRVLFLGHREDARQIIAQLDCLWLASEYEGQSNAILEAMASGVTVIASDIPGNRDLVVSEETGYLVPLGDRAAFSSKTMELIENPELRSRLGNAARHRAAQEFSVAQMVKRHADLYRRLMD